MTQKQKLETALKIAQNAVQKPSPDERVPPSEKVRRAFSLGKSMTAECRVRGLLTNDQHIVYKTCRDADGRTIWVPGVRTPDSTELVTLEECRPGES